VRLIVDISRYNKHSASAAQLTVTDDRVFNMYSCLRHPPFFHIFGTLCQRMSISLHKRGPLNVPYVVQALTRTPYTTHPQDILKFDLSYWPSYLWKSHRCFFEAGCE